MLLLMDWLIMEVEYTKTCNITSYGAKGDGKTDNTKFIQSAIDDIAQMHHQIIWHFIDYFTKFII